MTYYAGTHGLAALGIPNDDPRIVCDECAMVYRLRTDRAPPSWFLDRKAPPGWKRSRGLPRLDWCPRCRDAAGKAVPR
jgi:hypothetical protein